MQGKTQIDHLSWNLTINWKLLGAMFFTLSKTVQALIFCESQPLIEKLLRAKILASPQTVQDSDFYLTHVLVGSALDLHLSVCVSVCVCVCDQLTKLFNIFGSGWDIFLKSFGDIPKMFVHYFQILVNFLYVCHSVILLTSLLKLDKYRDIFSSGWYIFLKIFGGIPWMLVH